MQPELHVSNGLLLRLLLYPVSDAKRWWQSECGIVLSTGNPYDFGQECSLLYSVSPPGVFTYEAFL